MGILRQISRAASAGGRRYASAPRRVALLLLRSACLDVPSSAAKQRALSAGLEALKRNQRPAPKMGKEDVRRPA